MPITPSRLKIIAEIIRKRLQCINTDEYEIRFAYEYLLEAVDQASHSDTQDFINIVQDQFPPERLFHPDIIAYEGKTFYTTLRTVLGTAGVTLVPSRTKSVALQVAHTLYCTPEYEGKKSDQTQVENELYEAAVKLFEKSVFPQHPKRYFEKRKPARIADKESSSANVAEEENNDVNEFVPECADGDVPEIQIPRTRSEEHQAQMETAIALRDQREDRNREYRGVRGAHANTPNSQYTPSNARSSDSEFLAAQFRSRQKSSFIQTLMKRPEKDHFTGTDGRSWSAHLEKFIELGKAHDVIDDETLLLLVQWSLGPGPTMNWKRYVATESASWTGFQELMGKAFNSEITHARARDAISAVSLREELLQPVTGDVKKRHSAAVTRVIDRINVHVQDLPDEEKTDKYMLSYLRNAVRGVYFTHRCQVDSYSASQTFHSFSLDLQTTAQVEDHNTAKRTTASTSTKPSTIFEVDDDRDDSDLDEQCVLQFENFFTDRRLGRIPKKRSPKCGDNKRQNGQWNGKILKCYGCNSKKHLQFHRECPEQVKRRDNKQGILNGVQSQLRKGVPPSQILACVAIALEDATCWTSDTSAMDKDIEDDTVGVTFNVTENSQEGRDADDELLFQTNFSDRLLHSITASMNLGSDFQGGHAM